MEFVGLLGSSWLGFGELVSLLRGSWIGISGVISPLNMGIVALLITHQVFFVLEWGGGGSGLFGLRADVFQIGR